MSIINQKMTIPELLAGLAEEAAELAQAALKYRRTLDKSNPTPVDEDTAYEHLLEECADVKLYFSMLPVNARYVSEIMERKKKRWEERLAMAETTKTA